MTLLVDAKANANVQNKVSFLPIPYHTPLMSADGSGATLRSTMPKRTCTLQSLQYSEMQELSTSLLAQHKPKWQPQKAKG